MTNLPQPPPQPQQASQLVSDSEPVILQPSELGLVGYSNYRPAQADCLKQLLANQSPWQLVQGPTGSGKSLLAAAYHLHFPRGTKMVYTCHSKTLQSQFARDFPHAVELQGRSNYPCNLYPERFPDITAADCVAGHFSEEDKRECKSNCPYECQKYKALRAPVAVLNTAKLLTDCLHVQSFREFSLLVIDEADTLEDALMSMVEVRIPKFLIRQLRLQPPPLKTKQETWLEWGKELSLKLTRLIADVANQVREEAAANSSTLLQVSKELARLNDLSTRVRSFVQSATEQVWVNCTTPDGTEAGPWVFKPVLVNSFAEEYLWQHFSRAMLMSATIIAPRIFAQSLGIPTGEWAFIEMPSTFPAERRPILFRPAAAMTYKNKQTAYPAMAAEIDKILASHPGVNILVHTHSYDLTRYLLDRLSDRRRLLSYSGAAEREEVLTRFRTTKGKVLLAPSLERGVDLPAEQCEVIIVAKVPYPSLGDKQVSSRLYGTPNGQVWYQVSTVRAIVQSTGRGMRSADDFCLSYILDQQFQSIPRNLLPNYWKEALV